MLQWERRLQDLSRLLHNCGETYFTPDLFRQNLNQFLQTSRTVTFMIQKRKSEIPGYEDWYNAEVIVGWDKDVIMKWAKVARNFIEKEGDLEMYSYVSASLIFSHLKEEDIIVDVPRQFLLQADINKIAKFAKANLPAGVHDAAVLQIERRWVANTLPDYELISALTYVYSNMYRLCKNLAIHLGGVLPESIPHPTDLDPTSNDVAVTRFIKLGKPHQHKFTSIRVKRDENFKPPAGLAALKEELVKLERPKDLSELVSQAAKKAEFTFNADGFHYPMLFLFNDDWKPIDFFTTTFADQADKFLFWRNVAKRAAYLRASAFIWVSEVWIRDMRNFGNLPIRELPIIGEQLQLVGGSISGEMKTVDWNIVRDKASDKATLQLAPPAQEHTPDSIFFVRPLIEAMQSIRPKI